MSSNRTMPSVRSKKPDSKKISGTGLIARGAAIVMAGFVLSNVVGLVRQILLTRAFGASSDLDTFYAAVRAPEIFFTLIAGGALGSAFIPVFTGFLEQKKKAAAWQLASAITNLVTLVLIAVSVIAWFFAPQLVSHVLVPEYIAQQQALTVSLLRILLLTPILFGISGLLSAMLNTHQNFVLPALAPSLYWLGIIFGVLFLAPSMGIAGVAWGAVLGAAMHLGIQLPGLIKLRGVYQPILGLRIASVREVGRLMAPRLLGVAAVQINFLVNTIVASGLAAGSLTALTIAFQVMTMPQVVIAQSIAIAALPTFSAQVAGKRIGEMRSTLASILRGVLLLSLPATVGLILLRVPITALLFQRGEFTAADTQLVAWALLWYTAGLVGHSVVEIVSRAFYALHDTRTPVLVGTAAMGLNVILSLTLPAIFLARGWQPVGGLALSNSFATFLEMLALLVFMQIRLRGLEGRQLLSGLLQAAVASAAMGAGIWIWISRASSAPEWVFAIFGIAIGLVIYAVAVWLLRVPEIRMLQRALVTRLQPSNS